MSFSLKSVADLLVFFQQYVMYIFIYICDQMVAKYLVTEKIFEQMSPSPRKRNSTGKSLDLSKFVDDL